MTLSEELSVVLEEVDNGVVVTRGVVYNLLTRCFLELRRQEHEIRVLKDKLYVGSE